MLICDDLKNCVVAIKDTANNILGTGFFIDDDGSLITCYHVIGDKKNEVISRDKFQVSFWKNGFEKTLDAEVIYASSNPKLLDFAILRLSQGKLHEGAYLGPVGKWERKTACKSESFGFRTPHNTEGQYAETNILGRTAGKLQLDSQAKRADQFRPGMSGAPILVDERIVGMIVTRFKDPEETIPYGLPIESIARVWGPLARRFQEQELHDKIFNVLKNHFTHYELENKICANLPSFFKVDCSSFVWEILESPYQDIISQLKQNKNIYKFVHWLQRNFSDIDMEELIPLTRYYGFVNREKELKHIRGNRHYIFINAPAGYGKTTLLRETELRYSQDGWLSVYIQVHEKPATCKQIASDIQKFLGVSGITSYPGLADIGSELANQLLITLQQFTDKHKRTSKIEEGIVLLLDNVERMSDIEFTHLLNDFIPALYDNLRENSKFRVVFAGRYLGEKLGALNVDIKIPIAIESLESFRFDIVKNTVEYESTSKSKNFPLVAALVMQTTGGHPGCMAKIIPNISFQYPEAHFATNKESYEKEVIRIADSIRKTIPYKLQNVFDMLSVFRRYNYSLLQKIIQEDIFDEKWSADDLEKSLTSTYLVNRSEGFIQDEIVRRVLFKRLRIHEETAKFIGLCCKAVNVYRKYLSETLYQPAYIVSEVLFSELQYNYYKTETPSMQSSQNLHQEFFKKDGILSNCLYELEKKPEGREHIRNLLELLKKDWEFRFCLNFFLRGKNQYDDEPYKQLMRQTNTLID